MIARAYALALLVMLLLPAAAFALPVDDANAVLDRWSAAFSSNDPEAVVRNYWPDAILLGTASPIISTGTDALQTYFSTIRNSGGRNAIDERHPIVVDDNAVVITGFYTSTRMVNGQPVPAPARFTMLITKRGGEWRIAHHHSSLRPQPPPAQR